MTQAIAHTATMPPVPTYALRVIDALEAAGHEAWVVGGWVRDALRGGPSHDVDVTTDARWEEGARILRKAGIEVHETGTKHGTVTAVVEGKPVEVTTYRVEGSYSDQRHPDEVRFVTSVEDDLARRDFTINAMAYHPDRGLFDPFGGQHDLELGLVRAVGDPERRFHEDALRILRAVRFACRLGFAIEGTTHAALTAGADSLSHVSRERIGHEMDGIVRSGRLAWAMSACPEVMVAAIPELAPMMGFDQHSPYHCLDVYGHSTQVVAGVEAFSGGVASPHLRWAAFLHDIGKPHTLTIDDEGKGHFYSHPAVGAQMAHRVLRRLALPNSLERPATALVRLHDRPYRADRRSMQRMLADLDSACPGQARGLAFELLVLKRADAFGKAPRYRGFAVELDRLEAVLRDTLAQQAAFRTSDLAISGRDIIERVGLKPGPWVGETLARCLHEVVGGRLRNSRDELLAWLARRS